MANTTISGTEGASAEALLTALCETGHDPEARLIMDRLFSAHVQPWCREVVRRTLPIYRSRTVDPVDEAAEIEADVLLHMTGRLLDLRMGEGAPVEDLRSYVSTAVYNACYMRLRTRCPRRTQLQNRVRYLVRSDRRFALWQGGDGEFRAGLRRSHGSTESNEIKPVAFPPSDLAVLIERVLNEADGPVRFSALVSYAADALGIVDTDSLSVESEEELPGRPTRVVETLVHRQSLSALWSEVAALPTNQRAALLLNLRDAGGTGVIEWIPATGVATFDELASALGMQPEALAAIWNDLPFDDARIADTLGLNRQQVINLRKSARERLSRKMSQGSGNMGRNSASSPETNAVRRAGRAIRNLFAKGGSDD